MITRERRQDTDSGFSRESGGSLPKPKAKNDLAPTYPLGVRQLVLQSSFASKSTQSLVLPTSQRGCGFSIPQNSDPDLTQYNQDGKLFPPPGIKILRLEEERIGTRNRRGLSVSSTPNIVLSFHGTRTRYRFPRPEICLLTLSTSIKVGLLHANRWTNSGALISQLHRPHLHRHTITPALDKRSHSQDSRNPGNNVSIPGIVGHSRYRRLCLLHLPSLRATTLAVERR